MTMVMKVRIVKVGSAHGIRIPRPILEQLGILDEVELRVEEDELRIRAARPPKRSRQAAAALPDLDDEMAPAGFEYNQWEW